MSEALRAVADQTDRLDAAMIPHLEAAVEAGCGGNEVTIVLHANVPHLEAHLAALEGFDSRPLARTTGPGRPSRVSPPWQIATESLTGPAPHVTTDAFTSE
jgi:hypothetical protein